jgi:hypothetical protein
MILELLILIPVALLAIGGMVAAVLVLGFITAALIFELENY